MAEKTDIKLATRLRVVAQTMEEYDHWPEAVEAMREAADRLTQPNQKDEQ